MKNQLNEENYLQDNQNQYPPQSDPQQISYENQIKNKQFSQVSQVPTDYKEENFGQNFQEKVRNPPQLIAHSEYLSNKKRNQTSYDNIFNSNFLQQQPVPQYNNRPMTNADKIRIQKEYAKVLDGQINAKKLYKETYDNLCQKAGGEKGGVCGGEKAYGNESENPYKIMRERNSKLKEIPQDPFSKQYNYLNNNSNLPSNPILNPTNSNDKYSRRRTYSGRLQNVGSNIVQK